MNNAFPAARQRWAPRKFWPAVGLIFVLQVALIFVLSDRAVPVPPRPGRVPVFRHADLGSGEWLSLEDPTLFVLPHRQGFSGTAWLKAPRLEFHPEVRPEPLHLLSLPTQNITAEFSQFVQTNASPALQTLVTFEPTLKAPDLFPIETGPARSTFRFEGDLARRRLLPGEWGLEPRPNAELLTNSVVQLWVDARGNTFSAVLLPPRAGSKESGQYLADQYALKLARSMRFEPTEATGPRRARNTAPELTFGTLIIEWQTLPLTNEPATNSPP